MNLYMNFSRRLMERSKPGPEQAAIETMVLSRRAQQQGIVVDDAAINDLIRQITSDMLSRDAILGVIQSLRTGRKLSLGRVFDALRTEMLASKYRELFIEAISDLPPAQRFEYYLRLNRKAKAEVMPVAVADFTGQVPDPGPEELKALYEKDKDRYPDPSSSEPGFKQPKRAAFQYFKVDFAKLVDEYKSQITEEEIQKYYDENKSQFRAIDFPSDKKEEAAGDEEAKSTEESKTPEAETPEKPADEKPAAEAGSDEKPADKPTEKPADEGAGGDKPATDSKTPQSSRGPRSTPYRLVSATEQKPQVEAAGATADQPSTPSTEKPAAAEPPAEAKPDSAAAPANEAADKEEPAADAAKTEEPGKPEGDSEAEAAKPTSDIKYEPLEKVHDTIRDSLASQKAGNRITEIFDAIRPEMDRYSDQYERYTIRKETDKSATPPRPLDFAELAKKHGIQAKELPLVTAAEAATEDIGQVSQPVRDPNGFSFHSIMFGEWAFADSLPLYKPTTAQDSAGNGYLFWKVKEERAYVPTLDQIRDKVAKAWKMIQARELARKRADEYATQARRRQAAQGGVRGPNEFESRRNR